MKLSDILAQNLKAARQDAGLNQVDVASKLGLTSHSAISEIESGNRRVSATELGQLAEVFGKPIDWFFDPTADQENFVSLARAQEKPEGLKKILREVERFYNNFLLLRSLLKKG